MVAANSFVWRVHDDNGPPGALLESAFPACGFGPVLGSDAAGYPGLAFNVYTSSVLAAPGQLGDAGAMPVVSSGGAFVMLTATFMEQAAPAVLLQLRAAPCDSASAVAASLGLDAGTIAWDVGDVSLSTSLPLGARTIVTVRHDASGRVRLSINGTTVRSAAD
jgi:hypothetical protein